MIISHRLKFSILASCVIASQKVTDFTQHVNLFIGTEGPVPGTAYSAGNVFPGASLPFGAVKVGIDTTRWNVSFSANAGYTPDGNVTAITMLHESGTGGAPTYGLIPQMPITTLDGVNLLDNLTYMQPRVGEDIASVGYYQTRLENGVTAEISASMHAGIIKYQYPESGQRLVVVDLSHFIPSTGKKEQWYSNGFIERSEDGSWYSGYGVYREGWAWGGDFRVYFCGHFDTTPSEAQLFSGKATDPYWPNTTDARPTLTSETTIQGGTIGYQYADRIGALFEFPHNITTITSKVGVSWISADKACQFLEEIPGWDFNATVDAAKDQWNTEVLSKIDVKTANQTRLEMFYTGLYHAHLLPSDRTGENPNWVSNEPYYDDFYTIWDTFRCLHALTTLILPDRVVGIVRALIDIWRFERFMPDGRSHNVNGRVQGGSNADNVLADAYVKGLQGGINWTDGYLAMKTNAELQPYNNFDFEDPTGSTKEGRGALQDWRQYGYVTPNRGRSLSKTTEYSHNDFSLSQVAKGVAPNEVGLYLNRSRGWQKTWNTNVTSLNFTGFLAPTYGNRTIQNYDPLSCGACEWSSISYEGVPWEYSFSFPFDMETLISLMGGQETFESRLDTMFIPGLTKSNQGGNSAGTTIFNPGNEPSFMTPFLYNYLPQRQHKSVKRSREIVDQYYNTGRSGIPGNDDAGAMSSWLVWNQIGLYPVVTQPVYLILAPWFDDITLKLGDDGCILRVKASGLEDGIYVQSLKVNGQDWNQSWVSHQDLVRPGGEDALLEFELGPVATLWDSGDVPPSPGATRSQNLT
ncbi:alpha-1,2-mannosidase family protein-like protein [Truncatella angustata]|uniref:Alpha-1,2-mannosidase family protein-like protein n=1 Tax=Truncatella angustata TaxID=152316 RepID=A0A9P8UW42_9PEZI|nr:alpha-1,2-mannosidase family protein-like protein [Truncatella angustata]KAH6659425.1 alpha-1,2-mannosidase family protein-like protein [Truncatella angustata]